ncbi:MAG TPA: nuclear transport factor 2 family protein [Candidatus Saccharimonadales bacterium]|nr:nuclear transport factor 2 family protein [Candidatus Saccharimonadales bacterium]
MLHHRPVGPLRVAYPVRPFLVTLIALALTAVGLGRPAWIAPPPCAAAADVSTGRDYDPCSRHALEQAEMERGVNRAVLAFREAFMHRDLDAYAALLADDFVFRFAPEDAAPGLPDTLDRAGELRFARNLFQGGAVSGAPPAERIELEVELQERVAAPRGGVTRRVRCSVMTHLRVHLRGGGEFRVDGPVVFEFRREGSEVAVWRLVEWVDHSGEGQSLAIEAPAAHAWAGRAGSQLAR